MTDILVYGGVTLVIIGCLIVIIGAIRYAVKSNARAGLCISHEVLRLQFARCRMAWMILSLLGVLIVLAAWLLGD